MLNLNAYKPDIDTNRFVTECGDGNIFVVLKADKWPRYNKINQTQIERLTTYLMMRGSEVEMCRGVDRREGAPGTYYAVGIKMPAENIKAITDLGFTFQ